MSGRRPHDQCRLTVLLGGAGRRLFRDADAYASAHGWAVDVRCGGLARRYRDPRFDRLAQCQACGGHGTDGDLCCPPCGGTGRLDLGRPTLAGGRRG